jgi:hypothetical protein
MKYFTLLFTEFVRTLRRNAEAKRCLISAQNLKHKIITQCKIFHFPNLHNRFDLKCRFLL